MQTPILQTKELTDMARPLPKGASGATGGAGSGPVLRTQLGAVLYHCLVGCGQAQAGTASGISSSFHLDLLWIPSVKVWELLVVNEGVDEPQGSHWKRMGVRLFSSVLVVLEEPAFPQHPQVHHLARQYRLGRLRSKPVAVSWVSLGAHTSWSLRMQGAWGE